MDIFYKTLQYTSTLSPELIEFNNLLAVPLPAASINTCYQFDLSIGNESF